MKKIIIIVITICTLALFFVGYIYFFGLGKKMLSFHEVNRSKDKLPFTVSLLEADGGHVKWQFDFKEEDMLEVTWSELYYIYEKKALGWFPVDDIMEMDTVSVAHGFRGKSSMVFEQKIGYPYGTLEKGKYLVYKEVEVKNIKTNRGNKYTLYLRFEI